MKKSAWIALFVLAVLAGVFFVIRDEPKTGVEAPTTIERVKELSRIEIVPPASTAQAKLIVLERRDDTWRMTRPHQSALSPAVTGKLRGLFAQDIRTDDLRLDPTKRAKYGLDEASAVKLSAYSEGSDSAAVELEIGKEISVPGTRARRTYLEKAGEDEIYRAQIALGDFVRQPADDLRARAMVALDPEAIMDVSITHQDGAQTRLARQKDRWELVAPLVGAEATHELDQTAVKRLVNTLARVRAAGFADDAKPAEVGLDPAKVSVSIETIDDQTHRLELGEEAEGEKFYARFDDGAVFTVAKSVAERVSPKADALLVKEKAERDVEE